MNDDIPNDRLLGIAYRAVREADREAAGVPEGPPPVPTWASPQLDDRAAALQARLDKGSGRNRSAEERDARERELISYL
jgi:hypothetical protein